MLFSFLKPIGILLEVLVVFNLMIIVHELGHFLAARWRGLVIEKFGIWFGKPLWKKKIGGVEYSLGTIPAGGFVALPQLAPMEVMEGKIETPREQLPPISALDKIIVAFAGPLFSFGLACVFAVIVWQAGRPVSDAEKSTTVGYVAEGSPAAEAGLKPGDVILSLDGHRVTRFNGMSDDSITWRIIRSEAAAIEMVVERDGQTLTLYPKPSIPEKTHWWNRKGLRQIGFVPSITTVVGEVTPKEPGAVAGLKPGDVITAVNGEKLLAGSTGIYEYIDAHPGTPIILTVQRDTQELRLNFDPLGVRAMAVEKDSPAGAAGIQKDDVILTADGRKIAAVRALVDYVGAHDGVPITLHLRRGDKETDVKVTPQVPMLPPDAEKKAKIGVVLAEDHGLKFEPLGRYTVIHPGPVEQIRAGMMSIVSTLDAIFSHKSSVSVQHMGGPVMMMNAYYNILSGPEGVRMALWFSVILNVNLALLNLLPIPVLDGGHITLAILESIRRRPVNVKVLEFVQTACALVIIGFMVFIAFFDVQDLPFFGGSGKTPQIKFRHTSSDGTK